MCTTDYRRRVRRRAIRNPCGCARLWLRQSPHIVRPGKDCRKQPVTLIRSFTHSLIHSLIHSFTHSLISLGVYKIEWCSFNKEQWVNGLRNYDYAIVPLSISYKGMNCADVKSYQNKRQNSPILFYL